jgi:hypothetical protein
VSRSYTDLNGDRATAAYGGDGGGAGVPDGAVRAVGGAAAGELTRTRSDPDEGYDATLAPAIERT